MSLGEREWVSSCALALCLVACGAKSSLWLGPEVALDAGGDAAPDAGWDAEVEAGPMCGAEPACAEGRYCCALDECQLEGLCCTHEDCPEGLACPALDGVCAIGDLGCGLAELVPDARPANVMLMLDRSESMYEEIGGRTKWEIAASSLRDVLPRFEDDVHFGLTLFPGAISACQEGAVAHGVGEATAAQIQESVDNSLPGRGGTPIGETLDMLGELGGLEDPAFAQFVLLLSDGSETCLGHPATVAEELYDGTPRIQVYPVGFGSRVDDGLLGEIARASHTESGSARGYWRADDAEELTEAFGSILSSVIQCEFPLENEAPVPSRVYAFFGETAVARDATNGFEYDRDTHRVTFFGDACTTVRTGDARIRIVFGCPRGED
jgi:hypothetical protein